MNRVPPPVAAQLQALAFDHRAVAYLKIDAQFALIEAGGHLDVYGLDALELGAPVEEQVYVLQGLLPLPETPYKVPSVELETGRVADFFCYVEDGFTWIIVLDVTAERDAARRVQQKAYDMTLLQEREAQLNQRLEATNAALRESERHLMQSREALAVVHEQLKGELAEAARYVRALLPAPTTAPFAIDWRHVPSAQLGGDALGYHWIDDDHFALYLLDVCGHGVGPCLLSVAVLRVLQATSLRDVDFRAPGAVLAALNDTFQMQNREDLYFTLWYGVYRPSRRTLSYACAGHPAAVMIDASSGEMELLKAKGVPIGLMPDVTYPCETRTIPHGRSLFLLSDGAFEIEGADGTMLEFEAFLEMLIAASGAGEAPLDALHGALLALRGGEALEDDFSIVHFNF